MTGGPISPERGSTRWPRPRPPARPVAPRPAFPPRAVRSSGSKAGAAAVAGACRAIDVPSTAACSARLTAAKRGRAGRERRTAIILSPAGPRSLGGGTPSALASLMHALLFGRHQLWCASDHGAQSGRRPAALLHPLRAATGASARSPICPLCAAWMRRAGQRLLQLLPPHELSAGRDEPLRRPHGVRARPHLRRRRGRRGPRRRGHRRGARRRGAAPRSRARARLRARRLRDGARAQDARPARRVRALPRARVDAGTRRAPGASRSSSSASAHGSTTSRSTRRCASRTAAGAGPRGPRASASARRARSRQPRARARPPPPRGRVRAVDAARAVGARARRAMRELGVELMGDLPFVVCTESADVWSHASQFQLHLSLGAPPDAYSADGQDWGLPPYDWLAMEADDLAWIRARTRHAARALRPLPARSRRRLLPPVGEATRHGRQRGRFDPEGDGRAERPRPARARRDARGARRATRDVDAAARPRRGPRRHPAVRARRAARSSGCRATACCPGRRTTTGASAIRTRSPRRASPRGARTTRRPSCRGGTSSRRHDRAQLGGARRRRTGAWTSATRTLALLARPLRRELGPRADARAGAARASATASTRRRRWAATTGAGACPRPIEDLEADPAATLASTPCAPGRRRSGSCLDDATSWQYASLDRR